jgi:hypothetical protein
VTTTGDAIVGSTFTLAKEWFDPSPAIELVEVHYVWGIPAAAPDWDSAERAVAVRTDPTRPDRRVATLELPRLVSGTPDYLLHYFFFFAAGGNSMVSTRVFTEQIGTREVTYEDPEGRYTHVGVLWSTPGSPDQNYVVATLDGLPFSGENEGAGGGTLAPIYEFVQSVPTPHTFRARVWGVRNQPITYAFHLIRLGSPNPADDVETWENNTGRGWELLI